MQHSVRYSYIGRLEHATNQPAFVMLREIAPPTSSAPSYPRVFADRSWKPHAS